MGTYPREFAEQVNDSFILPPGARHVGEAVGNTFPNQICCIPAHQHWKIQHFQNQRGLHSFSPLKPSINVNMLLVSENPAFAKATLSRTRPIRSFKLNIESCLAASAEILAVISGL